MAKPCVITKSSTSAEPIPHEWRSHEWGIGLARVQRAREQSMASKCVINIPIFLLPCSFALCSLALALLLFTPLLFILYGSFCSVAHFALLFFCSRSLALAPFLPCSNSLWFFLAIFLLILILAWKNGQNHQTYDIEANVVLFVIKSIGLKPMSHVSCHQTYDIGFNVVCFVNHWKILYNFYVVTNHSK